MGARDERLLGDQRRPDHRRKRGRRGSTTDLGRVTQLRVSQSFRVRADAGAGRLADRGWRTGLARRACARRDIAATSNSAPGRRARLSTSIAGGRRARRRRWARRIREPTYLDDFGYDTRSRAANLSHTLARSAAPPAFGALYSFSDSDSDAGDGLSTPMTNQNIELSFGYYRRLSPTRQLQVDVGGGATHVSTLNALRPIRSLLLDALRATAPSPWTSAGAGRSARTTAVRPAFSRAYR